MDLWIGSCNLSLSLSPSLYEWWSIYFIYLSFSFFRLCLYHRDVGPSHFVGDSIIQVLLFFKVYLMFQLYLIINNPYMFNCTGYIWLYSWCIQSMYLGYTYLKFKYPSTLHMQAYQYNNPGIIFYHFILIVLISFPLKACDSARRTILILSENFIKQVK